VPRKCMECGFCEPVCPSRNVTMTPRQRIALRREMTRQKSDSVMLVQLQPEYQYDGIETCAGEGTCATVTTQAGVLAAEAKVKLAGELTEFHAEYAGVPKNWAHVVFQDYAPGSGFTAGEVSATVALTLLMRTGRSPDYKRGMLTRLWELLQVATGAPDDQIVIGIQEVPASQAMEMGKIMPDVADQ